MPPTSSQAHLPTILRVLAVLLALATIPVPAAAVTAPASAGTEGIDDAGTKTVRVG